MTDVYFFNDRRVVATVYVGSLASKAVNLRPATGQLFNVPCKENEVVFIKTWENGIVLMMPVEKGLI